MENITITVKTRKEIEDARNMRLQMTKDMTNPKWRRELAMSFVTKYNKVLNAFPEKQEFFFVHRGKKHESVIADVKIEDLMTVETL